MRGGVGGGWGGWGGCAVKALGKPQVAMSRDCHHDADHYRAVLCKRTQILVDSQFLVTLNGE